MSNSADKLGFYFIIFQRDLSNKYVKCWIDGDENYTFMSNQEFLDFFNEEDSKLKWEAEDALSVSSIFMWDVEAHIIKRLKASFDPKSLREDLKKKTDDLQKEEAFKSSCTKMPFIKNIFDNPFVKCK